MQSLNCPIQSVQSVQVHDLHHPSNLNTHQMTNLFHGLEGPPQLIVNIVQLRLTNVLQLLKMLFCLNIHHICYIAHPTS